MGSRPEFSPREIEQRRRIKAPRLDVYEQAGAVNTTPLTQELKNGPGARAAPDVDAASNSRMRGPL